jgi:tyrosinase
MKSNLGPKSATVGNVPANPQSDGLGYNPRCLRRDVSVQNAKGTATSYIMQLLTASRNNAILPFQNEMQGYFPDGTLGVHGGGHFTIGGDPGGVSIHSNIFLGIRH